LRLMSALWGEMKVTACTPHREAVYQQCNQPGRQAMSPLIDVCSVSGPLRFVTLIACICARGAVQDWE